MKPLLAIMNPRRIPRCIAALEALRIDKVWMTGFTEKDLEPVVDDIVEDAGHKGYTHLLMMSDDTVPTQAALDKVLFWTEPAEKLHGAITTAYCNLDAESPFVNLTSKPFTWAGPVPADYAFVTREEVEANKDPFWSHFTGMCFTCMSLDRWQRFPFRVVNDGSGKGCASDWLLSSRLQRAKIPIVAPVGAFVEHVKAKWNQLDQTSDERRLLIGQIEPVVRWDVQP